MITCVLILHNICVTDRVMDGDVYARYVPTNTFDSPADTTSNRDRPGGVAGGGGGGAMGNDGDNDDAFLPVGISNAPIEVQRLLTRCE